MIDWEIEIWIASSSNGSCKTDPLEAVQTAHIGTQSGRMHIEITIKTHHVKTTSISTSTRKNQEFDKG